MCRRLTFFTVLFLTLILVSACLVTGAGAEEQLTINGISVNKQSVYPGETVRVTVSWTNNTDLSIATTVICRSSSGSTTYEQQLNMGNSGTAVMDFPIQMSAALTGYDIMIYSGDKLLSKLDQPFAVYDIPIVVSNVTPSESKPENVYAGDTVNVSFSYSSPVNTTAVINIGNKVSTTINLSSSTGTATANLVIPAGTPEGFYNLTISFQGSTLSITENSAVRVIRKPTAELNITSPTRTNPVTVRAGDSLTVSYNYNFSSDTTIIVRLVSSNNSELVFRETTLSRNNNSGSTSLTLPSAATAGKYNVVVLPKGSSTALSTELEAVTVGNRLNITSPIRTNPVTVRAGESLTVSYNYNFSSDTPVIVRLVSSNNTVLVSREITLSRNNTSGSTSLTLPSTAAAGKYNVVVLPKGSSTALSTELEAVTVTNTITNNNITSPTRSNPVTVVPGNSITVKYNYSVTSDTLAILRLVSSNNTVLVSREVTLSRSSTSGSTSLTVPSTAAAGKYDVVLLLKNGGTILSTQREAVIIENSITVDITTPTKSKPVTVAGGDKITVSFDYTADSSTSVQLRIQKSDSDVLLTSTVSLDKATITRQKTATVTIPSNASGGKYNLVINSPGSGTTLDTEKEAVIVDAKISADITSPTKTKTATVKTGSALQVKFDYTASSNSSVDIKVLKKDGSALATASTSLDRTTTSKSKTVSVNIPSSATPGKYDLTINYKHSGKVLDTETQAVVIEDPVTLKVISPTKTSPARFNTTGKVEVSYRYTADTSNDVEVRLLKPDGKMLVKTNSYLTRTTTERTDKVELNLPSVTPAASYDLEIVSRNSGNRIAFEPKAVIVTSHPVDIQVRFIIGQSGRWVNGTYQITDMGARIIQSRTMLPIRHVGEPLGWELRWDDTSKMATVIQGNRQVRVWVNYNSGQLSTNGGNTWQTVRIDPDNASVQPLLISGRVLLPLRFVSEALDARVDWDATTSSVTVKQ